MMKILKQLAILFILFIFGLLFACGNPVSHSTKPLDNTSTSNYIPVTIENCGITVTYDRPPERAVSLNQPATEILLALGLGDRTIGTAYLDDRIPAEYQQTYERIPVLAEQYPSQEILLAAEPDFVYASFPGAFDENGLSRRQELLQLGVLSYQSPATLETCKLNESLLETSYREIREIGRIFAVEERAEQLILSLQKQLENTQQALNIVDKRKRVFWYASGEPPYTVTKDSLPDLALKLAGGENIFSLPNNKGTYVTVNWEDVIERNPEVIVLSDAVWSPLEPQKQVFLSNSAYAKIVAVQQEQFIPISYRHSTSIVSFPEGVEKIAKALYPERFKE